MTHIWSVFACVAHVCVVNVHVKHVLKMHELHILCVLYACTVLARALSMLVCLSLEGHQFFVLNPPDGVLPPHLTKGRESTAALIVSCHPV